MTIAIDPPPRYLVNIPSRFAEKVSSDRGAGHRLLMALLPDGVLNDSSPRQSARLLWAMTKPTELLVSTDLELSPTTEISITPTNLNPPELGKTYLLRTTIEASYTPATWVPEEIWNQKDRPNIHGKRVPVPQEKFEQWLDDKLNRAGFSKSKIESFSLYRMPVRKHTFPVADITAVVSVHDNESALKAYADGLGRGKNFSCGLLQLHTLA